MTQHHQAMDTPRSRCSLAVTYQHIAVHSIFSRITEQTARETFAAVHESLRQLCAALEQQADWLHYGSPASLTHYCVRDAYTQATVYLHHLSLTQPAPAPPAEPGNPAETLADIVRDVGDSFQPNPEATPLGIQTEHPPC